MQPNSDQNSRGGVQVPGRDPQPPAHTNPRDAATQIMRQQIDKIYDDPQPNEQIGTSPYNQTHSNADDIAAQENSPAIQAHWQKYHSAWQQYYQMYYERYYQSQLAEHAASKSKKEITEGEEGKKADGKATVFTKEQATHELRSELMKKVAGHTEKIRKSRHFMPSIVAVTVAAVFLFLQYNPFLIATAKSFLAPGSLESGDFSINPGANVAVGPEPKILIPSINVEAPVVYDLTTLQENVVQSKLKHGVVHYPIPGANALPGQVGNTVILGHSSNDVFDDGAYKFIFVQLDRLNPGDIFYLHYNSVRYTYRVSEKKVISPTQVGDLVINNGKPLATLVTCTPVGTALNRLVVIGEQISPDPSGAAQQTAEQQQTQNEATQIGGNAPSFFERLFGSGN